MSTDRPLRVIVTVKQVLDPEAPPSLLEVDPTSLEVRGRGVAPRLDPYSMHALQAALVLREHTDRAVQIHVVGAGPSPSRNLYLRALACGADRVSLLDTASLGSPFADAWSGAGWLARLVGHVAPGGFDLVLTGRRAADTNAGAVGPALAALLEVPLLPLASALRLEQVEGRDHVVVEQLANSGTNTLAVALPALVTVSHEVGEVPVVPFAKMVEAKKMPLGVLTPVDLGEAGSGGDGAGGPRLVGMHEREERRSCEIIEGADDRDAGRGLARRLLAM